MYRHHCRHNTTTDKRTAPRAVDKYMLHLSCQTMKHSSMAGLVHFPYFITLNITFGSFLLLCTPKLRVVAPPHAPWLGTTPPVPLAMQERR